MKIKKIFSSKSILIGTIIISFLLLIAVTSFFYTPHNPISMNYNNTLESTSRQHLLGTDNFGRDILSRLMIGTQTAFYIGFLTVLIGGIVGVAIGSIAGYYGGFTDTVLMRLIDAQMAFPGVLIALMIISIFGTGLRNTIISLGIMAIPRFTRVTRSGFLQYKNSEFVKTSIARGANDFRIMYIHIFPNILSSLIVTATLSFGISILSEAGLSYLGFGIQPPTPSWGSMLREAQVYMVIRPLQVIYPGIFITLIVLGFNLLGDGLRDILDRD